MKTGGKLGIIGIGADILERQHCNRIGDGGIGLQYNRDATV